MKFKKLLNLLSFAHVKNYLILKLGFKKIIIFVYFILLAIRHNIPLFFKRVIGKDIRENMVIPMLENFFKCFIIHKTKLLHAISFDFIPFHIETTLSS